MARRGRRGLRVSGARPLLLSLAAVLAHPAAALAQLAPAASDSGTLAGKVILLRSGRPEPNASGAVVYLPRVRQLLRHGQDRMPTITQSKKTFTPRVLVVPAGTTVAFPSLDRIFHNAFSLSESCRFDLGLYRNGVSRSKTFDTPGVCRVYCNIHPQMSAVVLVTEGSAATVTGPDGAYRLDGLPPGRHSVSVWHEKGAPIEELVEIVAGQKLTRDFPIDVSGYRPAMHTRKDGSPYGAEGDTRY